MSKNSEHHDTYIIPPNFIEGSTLFGGMFKIRNVIEAGVLAEPRQGGVADLGGGAGGVGVAEEEVGHGEGAAGAVLGHGELVLGKVGEGAVGAGRILRPFRAQRGLVGLGSGLPGRERAPRLRQPALRCADFQPSQLRKGGERIARQRIWPLR